MKNLLRNLQRRILLIIGKAIITSIDNSGLTQRLNLTLLHDEELTGVERYEDYGFYSYPHEGAQVLGNFIGGNRDIGIVVKVHDRRYRPDYLDEGDIAIATSADKDGEVHHVHMKKSTKDVDIVCNDITIDCSNMSVLEKVFLGAAIGAGRYLADERIIDLFNNHQHSGVTSGASNTGTPTTIMTEAGHFTSNTKAL